MQYYAILMTCAGPIDHTDDVIAHWSRQHRLSWATYHASLPDAIYTITTVPRLTLQNVKDFMPLFKQYRTWTYTHVMGIVSGITRLTLYAQQQGHGVHFPVDMRYGWVPDKPEHQLLPTYVHDVFKPQPCLESNAVPIWGARREPTKPISNNVTQNTSSTRSTSCGIPCG